MKKIISALFFTSTLLTGCNAWALMPANGIWGIDSENTGKPGRGFQIEAENEIIFFTYFGYRTDGSSAFYYAAGPISNNVFSADLLEFQGGTALGTSYKAATTKAGPGRVTLSFSSGKHGTISLPGESAKSISKTGFGYADGPDGLLGTWIFTTLASPSSPGAVVRTLNTKTGQSSSLGNGLVTTSKQDMYCEFITSTLGPGVMYCLDYPPTVNGNLYYFKVSGDRGTGYNKYVTSITGTQPTVSLDYESHALRIATKTGVKTGLNDGTLNSTLAYDRATTPGSTQPDGTHDTAPPSADNAAISVELAAWASEVQTILKKK